MDATFCEINGKRGLLNRYGYYESMITLPTDFRPSAQLEPQACDRIHLFYKDQYINATEQPIPLLLADLSTFGLEAARVQSIGSLDAVGHFAVALDKSSDAPKTQVPHLPEGWRAGGLRSWFGVLPDAELALAMKAVQVLEWQRTHRFCGACGSATEQSAVERAMRCPACGLSAYPRIAPAMMALVWRDDELLLARGVNFPPGRYSALAGFLEAGESIEDALRREVYEEVGVRVGELEYFASQSWPFPNSLMIAFRARWESGDIRPDPAEIADAQWFKLNALPQMPPRLSVARALIDDTLQWMAKRTS
jgi:NAD+ diphosphatase